MAERTHQTIVGDMLDYICWKYYGSSGVSQSPYVEKVLEWSGNYRLSDYPEVLPPSVVIELPAFTVDKPLVRLWDYGE